MKVDLNRRSYLREKSSPEKQRYSLVNGGTVNGGLTVPICRQWYKTYQMSKKKERLLAFLSSNEVCAKTSDVTDDLYSCLACSNFTVSLAQSSSADNKRNINRLIAHLDSKPHSTNSGWRVTYTPSDPQPFKLIKMHIEEKKQSKLFNFPSAVKRDQNTDDIAVSPDRSTSQSPDVDRPCSFFSQDKDSLLEPEDTPSSELQSHKENLNEQQQFQARYQQTDETVLNETGTQCSILTEEGVICDFYKDSLHFNVREDFSSKDVIEAYADLPLLRGFTENKLLRGDSMHRRHTADVKEFAVGSALMFSQSSAAHWSTALGGPGKTTIKTACQKRTQILPNLSEATMRILLLEFRLMLARDLKISEEEIVNIPCIAAHDATPVTGRVNTSADKLTGSDRLLFGIEPSWPYQEIRIKDSNDPTQQSFLSTQDDLLVNGYTTCADLLKSNQLNRCSGYMAIILQPLITNPKPYCLGMFGLYEGFCAADLMCVHSQVCNLDV